MLVFFERPVSCNLQNTVSGRKGPAGKFPGSLFAVFCALYDSLPGKCFIYGCLRGLQAVRPE